MKATERLEELHREEGGAAPLRVHLVSLGCPKNLIDSELILGGLGARGLAVTREAEDADVIVVNTCGFVDSAKEESVNTILEACELKKDSPTPKKVVVTGCLGQRYGRELEREIPELDAIVGLGEYEDLAGTLLRLARRDRGESEAPPAEPIHYQVGDPTRACNAEVGRFRLTPAHYAYIRVSEGCDNPCTFCAIPAIRGRFRSKPRGAILEEARELVASGARELVLISQDTTSYGIDLDGSFQLPRLLEDLAALDGVEWIRVLYAYPAFTTDALIDAIAAIPRVVNYVDIPLQHISDRMLRRMGRRMNETKTRRLLERMRERIPDLYLRTTFIVGFPGENEEDFATLESFIGEVRFERLGVFRYSREEGTPSASFSDQVPEEVAERRLEKLMLLQQEIAFEDNRRRRGKVVDVLVDAAGDETRKVAPAAGGSRVVARGRTYAEAPEIDPVVLLAAPNGRKPGSGKRRPREGARFLELPTFAPGAVSPFPLPGPGEIVRARITGADGYDLLAEPLPHGGI